MSRSAPRSWPTRSVYEAGAAGAALAVRGVTPGGAPAGEGALRRVVELSAGGLVLEAAGEGVREREVVELEVLDRVELELEVVDRVGEDGAEARGG